MRVGDVYIDALGTWLPASYSAERAVREGLYEAVDFEENGLLGTRVAGPEEAPAEMALRAVRQLAGRRGGDLSDVDLLVHAGGPGKAPRGGVRPPTSSATRWAAPGPPGSSGWGAWAG